MPKTHLPAHMDSVREKCRPKHQLLILKCYPRLPKNSSADVRPNGSELSYLLYYASTRSSKLSKVGAFLERKTAADVARFQSARVLVTLQILQALVEKVASSGSALALITPSVLRCVREILLHTTDISLVEATGPTWEVFCRNSHQAAFTADRENRELYEQVVGLYADLAYKNGFKKLGKSTQPVATHDAVRLREVGLGAIESVLQFSMLAYESGEQSFNAVIPAILTNLRGEDGAYIQHLVRLGKKNEEDEKDKAMNRRQSMAASRTHTAPADPSAEADPRAAEGTTQDADKLAEEEVAVLAMDCLKTVFCSENRLHVRSATIAILSYLSNGLNRKERPQSTEKQSGTLGKDSWAEQLFETITEWTPVQDRFVVVVTVVEILLRLPLGESDLRHHLLYTSLIDHILRSDLNLIGLSVMDMLLGLIQQTLNVLQLGRTPTAPGSPAMGVSGEEELKRTASSGSERPMSQSRIRLIVRLKDCIANLGTHVYYTDQITDMISAILLRLKPNATPSGQVSPSATAAAIEEPKAAVREASTISLQSRDRAATSQGFFSFDIARQMALEAVKDIIKVANSSRTFSTTGEIADSRNPIPMSIWDGTQWLLRDPTAGVRKAYVDALATWLDLETKKSDARISEPTLKPKKAAPESVNGNVARRAVSNASAREKHAKRAAGTPSTFLQLLHLSCYENALQSAPTSDSDMMVLHFLLVTLIRKLGVNAVKSGLPMIMALQEDIPRTPSAIAKIRIGGLVHGYLWTIVEVFDFQTDTIGQEVFTEIARRKQRGLWVKGISYPPMTLAKIVDSSSLAAETDSVISEDLKPFDHRQELVDKVAEAYEVKVLSPAPSAPGSPGRSFAVPRTAKHERSPSYLAAQAPESRLAEMAAPNYFVDRNMAARVKEGMMAPWSREACLASVATSAPKSASLSGSRSSPTQGAAAGNHRQLLAAADAGGNPLRQNSSPSSVHKSNYRHQAFGALNTRLHSQSPNRRPSASTNGRNGSSSAGAKGPLRVDELKRILAGGGGFTASTMSHHDPADDTGSDSMVDAASVDLGSDAGIYETPPQNAVSNTGGHSTYESARASHTDLTSLRHGSVKKSSNKKDLNALLAGISVDNDVGVASVVGMARPPY